MIQLNYKYTEVRDDGKSNSIIFKDEYFILECPGYKGGKPVDVAYSSVKNTGISRTVEQDGVEVDFDICELHMKILRTEVRLYGFDTDFALEAISLMSIGKEHTPISGTKEWRKLQKESRKEEEKKERREAKERRREERAERREEIISNVSAKVQGSIKGVTNSIFGDDEDQTSAPQIKQEAKEDPETQLKNRIDNLNIAFGETEASANEKLHELQTLIQRLLHDDEYDYDQNIVEYALSVMGDSIEVAKTICNNSPQLQRAIAKYNSFSNKAKDKKIQIDKSSKRNTIVGIIAFVILLAFWAICEHFHWLGF